MPPKDRDRRETTTPAEGSAMAAAIASGATFTIPDPNPPPPGEQFDDLTPPPQTEPDPIEKNALRIERRREAIESRPGPSPAPESMTAALTIHGVKAELDGVKSVVASHTIKLDTISEQVTDLVPTLLGELTKDRDARREDEAMTRREVHLKETKTTEIDFVRAQSEIELQAARERAELEVKTASRKARIERWTKAWAILGTIASLLLAASKC